MKKQLDQLTAYTPGLSPESLKNSMALKVNYINLLQMKMYMVQVQS